MKLNYLYDIAEKENILINNLDLDNIKGIFINYNKINSIGLNYSNINNSDEEKCILAEELGHYYMNATYSASCNDKTLIAKQEYRAKKWQYKTLVPINTISKLAKKGYKYAYEFAEELGVTEDIVINAINYYKNNNLMNL